MKKRFLAYAFLLTAIVSVTSGCVIHDRYGYNRRYHHDRYRNGYNNDYGHDHYHDSTHDRNY